MIVSNSAIMEISKFVDYIINIFSTLAVYTNKMYMFSRILNMLLPMSMKFIVFLLLLIIGVEIQHHPLGGSIKFTDFSKDNCKFI